MMVLAAMSLGSQLLVTVADRVPTFDVEPSCRAAAATAVVAGRDLNSCLGDERAAREQLVKSWNEFTASERQGCSLLSVTGGPASYVELLSCLEMKRDARNLGRENQNATAPNANPPSTVGQGTSSPR